MTSAFSPVDALAGGLLIGLAAVLLLLFNGRIAGISGIFSAILSPRLPDLIWRLLFIAGLMGGAILFPLLSGIPLVIDLTDNTFLLIASGLLVGFGTRLGSGCTSGHGICGLSRVSRRSLVSTLIFIAVAMATATVMHLTMGEM